MVFHHIPFPSEIHYISNKIFVDWYNEVESPGFTLSYARYGKLRNGYDVMQKGLFPSTMADVAMDESPKVRPKNTDF